MRAGPSENWNGLVDRLRAIPVATWILISLISVTSIAQSTEVKIVGVLAGTEVPITQLAQGLAEQGWIEGENLRIERRLDVWDPEDARSAAAELVGLQPDVLFGLPNFRALALAEATSSIPVVFSNVLDPIGAGLVDDLARPGGNVTGYTFSTDPAAGRTLQIFEELVPNLRKVFYLIDKATTLPVNVDAYREAAHRLELEIELLGVGSDGYAAALNSIADHNGIGLVVDATVVFWADRETIVAEVEAEAIPAMYVWAEFVEVGGLVSYGMDNYEPTRQAGEYVGRILNGEPLADLPVQSATKFILTVNQSAADALGIEIPLELAVFADTLIE